MISFSILHHKPRTTISPHAKCIPRRADHDAALKTAIRAISTAKSTNILRKSRFLQKIINFHEKKAAGGNLSSPKHPGRGNRAANARRNVPSICPSRKCPNMTTPPPAQSGMTPIPTDPRLGTAGWYPRRCPHRGGGYLSLGTGKDRGDGICMVPIL